MSIFDLYEQGKIILLFFLYTLYNTTIAGKDNYKS